MKLPICVWQLAVRTDEEDEKFTFLQKRIPENWDDDTRYPPPETPVQLSASPELEHLQGVVIGHDQPTEVHYIVGIVLLESSGDTEEVIRLLQYDGWETLPASSKAGA